jgi:hypothetical protein
VTDDHGLEEQKKQSVGSDPCCRIAAAIEYELVDSDQVVGAGRGTTVEISTSRMVFVPQTRIPAGSMIQASVHFPSHLEDLVPKLRLSGEAGYLQDGKVILKILTYDFYVSIPNRELSEKATAV